MTATETVTAHIAAIYRERGPLAAKKLAELYDAAMNAEGAQLFALAQIIATRYHPVDGLVLRQVELQGW